VRLGAVLGGAGYKKSCSFALCVSYGGEHKLGFYGSGVEDPCLMTALKRCEWVVLFFGGVLVGGVRWVLKALLSFASTNTSHDRIVQAWPCRCFGCDK